MVEIDASPEDVEDLLDNTGALAALQLEDERALLAHASLGVEGIAFLQSDLGRYIIGRANQMAQEAHEALASVHPWRRRRIQYLQNRIAVANSVKTWVADAVRMGKTSFDELDIRRRLPNG